jgi:cytochrome c5
VPTEVADPDRVLVEQKCSMCHTTQKVFAMEGDVAKWNGIVDRMKKNGLVISDEERTRIIDYLSTK